MQRISRIKILIIILSLVSGLAIGQSSKISGQIFDTENEETLSGATVSILGTKIKTIADIDGNFCFNLAPGVYKIEISMISYETRTETIEVKNEPSKKIKIKLNHVGALNSKEAESILVKQLVTQNQINKRA